MPPSDEAVAWLAEGPCLYRVPGDLARCDLRTDHDRKHPECILARIRSGTRAQVLAVLGERAEKVGWVSADYDLRGGHWHRLDRPVFAITESDKERE